MRPAWLGIVGWLLVLAGAALAMTAAAPLNGAVVVGVLAVAAGGVLVGVQVARVDEGRER